MENMLRFGIAIMLMAVAAQAECIYDKKKAEEDFGASIFTFSIIGVVFALLAMVAAAVPLCCGFGKQFGKIIAAIVIPIGILCCFFPLIGSSVATNSMESDVCEGCAKSGYTCTEADKELIQAYFGTLGFFFAYTVGQGWAAIVMGIVGSSLGCCICCKCCKMKDDEIPKGGGEPTVVGAPA